MEREREREKEVDGREAMRMRDGRETDREHKGGRGMVSARQSEGLTREQ